MPYNAGTIPLPSPFIHGVRTLGLHIHSTSLSRLSYFHWRNGFCNFFCCLRIATLQLPLSNALVLGSHTPITSNTTTSRGRSISTIPDTTMPPLGTTFIGFQLALVTSLQ